MLKDIISRIDGITFYLIAFSILAYSLGVPLSLLAVSAHSAWYTHITYCFAHGNAIHLLVNCYMLSLFAVNGYHDFNRVAVIGFLTACVASLACVGTIPTIGLSGVIFAIYGLLVARYPCKRDLIVSAICLAVGFIPPMNGMLHVVCWSMGFAEGRLFKYIKIWIRK